MVHFGKIYALYTTTIGTIARDMCRHMMWLSAYGAAQP